MKLFDYSNVILKKQKFDEPDEVFEKEFVPFIINRLFSCDQSLALVANEVNRNGFTKRMIFDLYFYGVPKCNKFISYNAKKAKAEKELQYIMEYYKCNMTTAKDYQVLLSEDDRDKIIEYFEKRGRK